MYQVILILDLFFLKYEGDCGVNLTPPPEKTTFKKPSLIYQKKSQNFIELLPRAQPFSRNKFLWVLVKIFWKRKIRLFLWCAISQETSNKLTNHKYFEQSIVRIVRCLKLKLLSFANLMKAIHPETWKYLIGNLDWFSGIMKLLQLFGIILAANTACTYITFSY